PTTCRPDPCYDRNAYPLPESREANGRPIAAARSAKADNQPRYDLTLNHRSTGTQRFLATTSRPRPSGLDPCLLSPDPRIEAKGCRVGGWRRGWWSLRLLRGSSAFDAGWDRPGLGGPASALGHSGRAAHE